MLDSIKRFFTRVFFFNHVIAPDHTIPVPVVEDMVRPIPRQAIELIKKYEGYREHAYKDASGIWTIGYGTAESVHAGETITEEVAEERLREHLQEVGPYIIRLCKKNLNNNEYGALLSFVYNVGIGAFQHSTLLTLINGQEPHNIAGEFLKWDKDAAGVVLEGLRARRQSEAALYFTPLGMVI